MTGKDARTLAGEYDYIVVGAGSAGCAVASRLAEDRAVTVALLENGPDDHHYTVWTPLGVAKLAVSTGPRNYGYFSEPQKALDGRRSFQPRGRGLGGSSSINGMVYMRGHRDDYDHWASLGCTGWGFDDVLPYFRRSERNQRCAGRDDDALHGGSGPLHVSDFPTLNPFTQRFIEAGMQAGLPLNADFNGPEQDGVGLYQVTQRKGERWNTARAYLHHGDASDTHFNGGRDNLSVLTETQAVRIEFDGKRATGVRVRRGGVEQVLKARREVILCAGSYNSPQLLMASGVGPAWHLREQGIEVVHDLPGVGENLQDHVDVTLTKQVKSSHLYGYSLGSIARIVREILRYRRDRTGMVASNVIEAGAFARSRPELTKPDLQLAFILALVSARKNSSKRSPPGYSCHVCVLRPESRGTLRLKSADMRDAPAIDLGFMTAESDMDILVEGVRLVRRIFAQPALASAGGRALRMDDFGPGTGDENAIRAYIRENADSLFHPVGTCKMGIDKMAVVDPHLRVRGIEGLRVADASIMPTLVGGNTNAPAIMIGEKAADLIRATQSECAYTQDASEVK
jgi:choline dehydrogenase-like flavoprotein